MQPAVLRTMMFPKSFKSKRWASGWETLKDTKCSTTRRQKVINFVTLAQKVMLDYETGDVCLLEGKRRFSVGSKDNHPLPNANQQTYHDWKRPSEKNM